MNSKNKKTTNEREKNLNRHRFPRKQRRSRRRRVSLILSAAAERPGCAELRPKSGGSVTGRAGAGGGGAAPTSLLPSSLRTPLCAGRLCVCVSLSLSVSDLLRSAERDAYKGRETGSSRRRSHSSSRLCSEGCSFFLSFFSGGFPLSHSTAQPTHRFTR